MPARASCGPRPSLGKDDADAETWIAIGELDKSAGHNKDARAAYDKALGHATGKDMKKKALRALADLALATGDNDGANAYFKQFLDLDPQNAQLWIERGDAMLAAGKRDVALESYAAAEKLLGSDPAKRVEVVARRGQALEGMGKDDESVLEYRRAIKAAPKGYYLEVELTGRVIDIYRRKQALPQLLAQYEKEWPEGARGHFEWDTLGKLYEETGAQDKAIAALKKAVGKAAFELETQRRLIQLLENSGRDDEALAQYEAVVRAAPGEARFQLELAERYWRRGAEKKALDALAHLETRFPSDPGVLSAIADMYTRWNKEDLAITEYERLAKLEPDDPAHLVTLGEQYFQKGDKKNANATWKRLTLTNKASGWAKLGEVDAEHGNTSEAANAYEHAIKLDDKNPEFYKGRAALREQQRHYKEALEDWETVLKLIGTKPTDRLARRDGRRHVVAMVVRAAVKETEYVHKWEAAFRATTPPDVESGYFLVEYYTRQSGRAKQGEPMATLEKLVTLVPDDQDTTLDLVKAYRVARKYDEAVALLLKLAAAVPSREREVYKQISEIKTDARKDDEAIEWQQKALAKSPNDPSAYEGLGERYVEMQRFREAIAAYEKTVQLDPRNSKAAFALAQLYVQTGTPMKASELLRNVLRNDTNEDVIARAGEQAIDLEEMTDTLGELEKVLSPLSFMMAHKPVYRRVLVRLYLRYVPRLVERIHHGNDEIKKAARIELDRVGAHGLRPLLEALRDEKDVTQQRIAVQVLGHLGNKGAAAPLVHMARQEPPKDQRRIGTLAETLDREVRVDALVAAGRLGDAAVIDDVLPMLDNQELAMREAATFTIGRSGDRRAVAPLLKALDYRRPSVQVVACLGLAQIDDPRVGPALIAQLKDAGHLDVVRAACAYAIGARKITAGTPALLAALDDNRGETQRLAAWALGQLGEPKALGPLVRAYFARAGSAADELVWAIGRVSGPGVAPAQLADLSNYPMRSGKFDQEDAVARAARRDAALARGRQARRRSCGRHLGRTRRRAVRASRRGRLRAQRSRRCTRSTRARRAHPDDAGREVHRSPPGDRDRDRSRSHRAAHRRGSEGSCPRRLGDREDGRRQAHPRGCRDRQGPDRSRGTGSRGGDDLDRGDREAPRHGPAGAGGRPGEDARLAVLGGSAGRGAVAGQARCGCGSKCPHQGGDGSVELRPRSGGDRAGRDRRPKRRRDPHESHPRRRASGPRGRYPVTCAGKELADLQWPVL